MYISNSLTQQILLTENEELLSGKSTDFSFVDDEEMTKSFFYKPLGILVQDSFNNPFFPINPLPKIDTSKLDLLDLTRFFKEKYIRLKESQLFLPWHYCVEMVNDQYFVFNTRPINMKFPKKNIHFLNHPIRETWDSVTTTFMENNQFDISEAIHVCIIGDTKSDVYPRKIYESIGRICVAPICQYFRINRVMNQDIVGLNLGTRFQMPIITKFLKI